MKNLSDTILNRTRDLPTCSAVRFFEATSIIHQDNRDDHGHKMGGRATARIKTLTHQNTDKIQFFVEGKPLELHRNLFIWYNLQFRLTKFTD
jgi:hypothetical protein